MPSLLPDFDHDVFISYRQNDNRSGWVTQFVKSLNEQLAATMKEPVSVYFDSNPETGLSSTHDVDESLKSKLKCLILIPIVSQTYCDPKSFAWRSEFIAFVRQTANDKFGLKVKLANGNVASRVLPVRIHELEAADQQLLEAELQGALRPVDFVYRSQEVVRPLLAEEIDPKSNQDHTYYRDQVNKVARGIKELITAMQNPAQPQKADRKQQAMASPQLRKQVFLAAATFLILGLVSFTAYYFGGVGQNFEAPVKSIAVIPFENMNKDSTQDYFSNGITEDILNHLAKISDLKVKSRTSTLQYKGTTKTLTQIGEELGVANILEGSVRRAGDKVRIVVQLIDAKTDVHLWSETYDRDFKDVLTVQSDIAIEIAKALKARLTSEEKETIGKEEATDVTAYDYFLKARDTYNSYNGDRKVLDASLTLVNESVRLDPDFSKSYALKGGIWYELGRFGFSEKIWTDSALNNADKALALDRACSEAYVVQMQVNQFIGRLDKRDQAIKNVYAVAPNNPEVQMYYGYFLLEQRQEKGADLVVTSIENQFRPQDSRYYAGMSSPIFFAEGSEAIIPILKKAISLNPNSVFLHSDLGLTLARLGRYEEALSVLQESDQTDPAIIDFTAFTYFLKGDYKSAAAKYEKYKEIEAAYEDKSQSVPFRHRLAMTYLKLGRKAEADVLVEEHRQILKDMIDGKRGKGTWTNLGGIYYDYAGCLSYQNKKQEAIMSLDSAFKYGWRSHWWYHNDPLFENISAESNFKRVIKKVDDNLEFRRMAFSNALNRSKASKELKERVK